MALLFAGSLLSGDPARAVEREIERVFPLQPGGTVEVDTYRGAVTVEESDASEVRVALHLDYDADTEAEAQRMREHLQLQFGAHDNVVTITARNPTATGVHLDIHGDRSITLNYHLTVPRRSNLVVRGGPGAATVGNLSGRIAVQLENGTIFCRAIEGTITASTGSGDVVISRCSGAVTARVRKGLIRMGTVGGLADVTNREGDIEVLTAEGGIVAEAQLGDLRVTFPRRLTRDAKLTTEAGNILVRIAPAADCLIDASASFGAVSCRVPINTAAGESTRRRVVGQMGAGGPVIALHASGGNVQIESGEPPFEDNAGVPR